ncbi:ParB family chromosome partitioning protein [Paenibacillus jamilae]|uniref:hypothetical protein n=1 Tax=Paenibacillus polymyxa TaxID=1406 RepID=UPI0029597B8A|nr:hypothetical protein [Paenibacillus polymyxa]MDP9676935.1 ParB family chromosome partitioning protein [Paenibacillus jamilae]MDY8025409.1 hypothetical protein [Paenibacillus polymyxa]
MERLKAKERQGTRTDIEVNLVENFPQCNQGKTRDVVAEAVGFGSGKQYEKAKYIADNADPETIKVK